jgi:hypothetical protein
MLDLLYILLTTGFFVAMLAYVRACQALGQRTGADSNER